MEDRAFLAAMTYGASARDRACLPRGPARFSGPPQTGAILRSVHGNGR